MINNLDYLGFVAVKLGTVDMAIPDLRETKRIKILLSALKWIMPIKLDYSIKKLYGETEPVMPIYLLFR